MADTPRDIIGLQEQCARLTCTIREMQEGTRPQQGQQAVPIETRPVDTGAALKLLGPQTEKFSGDERDGFA